ncbi:MAG: hypothetical protein ACTS2F_17640 [Thainema sp.]
MSIDLLPHLDITSIWHLILAQATPSPAPTTPPTADEIELLKSQLEFLKEANGRLSDNFSQFISAIQVVFVLFGVAGAIAAYFLGQNFKEFKELSNKAVQEAVKRVRQDTEAQIATLVLTEVTNVERTLRRERVISSTLVDYYRPGSDQITKEFSLLQARRFQNVRLIKELGDIRTSPGNVVVLDLQNWILSSSQAFIDLPEADRELNAKQQIDGLLNVLPTSAVVVVYTRITIKYLYSISNRYVLPANNPVTLVGNAVDGAYVAFGDRHIQLT